jgi:hypothetical protein
MIIPSSRANVVYEEGVAGPVIDMRITHHSVICCIAVYKVVRIQRHIDTAQMGAGVEDTPVPESDTTFGDPAAFVVIVTVPVRVPETVGVNVILSTQLAPWASME